MRLDASFVLPQIAVTETDFGTERAKSYRCRPWDWIVPSVGNRSTLRRWRSRISRKVHEAAARLLAVDSTVSSQRAQRIVHADVEHVLELI
ncbi:hypothetical protein EHM92_06615 [bacterium]|nr:MAG: hypothetical protein EHM92_06615 [bacterium]